MDGEAVPEPERIGLGNKGTRLEATILYADLVDSTSLVTAKTAEFAAEIYKTYLHCACKIIKNQGGKIVGFDGDRVMAIFVGKRKNTDAMKSGLFINGAVTKIINPSLKAAYPQTQYTLRQVVGIDTGTILVAKTGVRGDNDLVWVGQAANMAAKLCAIRETGYPTYCTKAVFDRTLDEATKSEDGRSMWENRTWTAEGGVTIYRSSWYWTAF